MAEMEQDAGENRLSTDGAGLVEQYWTTLRKHFWTMLLVLVATVAAGVFYTNQQVPVYRASAQLVIENETPRVLRDIAPVVEANAGENYLSARDSYRTQQYVIESLPIAQRVADELLLGSDPRFIKSVQEAGHEEDRAAIARDPAVYLQKMLTVEPSRDSQVLSVRVEATDPELAASIANKVGEVYIEQNQERQLESTENAASWLEQQHDELKERLEESEAALYGFRREHNLLSTSLEDRQNLTAQELRTLSDQLAEARLAADRLRSQIDHVQRIRESEQFLEASLEGIIDNQLIQQLKERLVELELERAELSGRYLDEHPAVVSVDQQIEIARRSLNREISAVLRNFQQEYDGARELAQRLERRLIDVRTAAIALGQDELAYNSLQREADMNRDLFSLIQRRLKEINLMRMLQQNNVHVLEGARAPEEPVRPRKLINILVSMVLGVVFAFGVALILELSDATVKSQETIERDLGVPFLGMMPAMKGASRTASLRGPARGQEFVPALYTHDFPQSTVAESCRAIRTNLLFMGAERPLDSLVVTSAGPKEGKTTTSVNLATVMAQSGTRVLLIDTDMRRPSVHYQFDGLAKVGISSVLLGEATIEEAVQETQVPNLYVLPCGPIPPNPVELIHTDRFVEVVNELKKRYDRLIFDSPPAVLVTDASVLSRHVDGVVIVVKSGKTRKDLLARAVESLRNVNANILGAVLNAVELGNRRHGSYYYYYYYRRYGQYYRETEEAPGGGSS